MKAVMKSTLLGTLLCASGGVQAAQPGADLICSILRIVECGLETQCSEVSTLTDDAPRFLRLNLMDKMVETILAGDRKRMSEVTTLVRTDNLLLLQGIDSASSGAPSAISWSMSLDEISGYMVISASGRNTSYTLFGACTVVD